MIHSTEVLNSCQLPFLPSITTHPEGLDILKNGRQIMSCLKCLMSPRPNPHRASRPGRVESFELRPSHSLRCIPLKSYNPGKNCVEKPRKQNIQFWTNDLPDGYYSCHIAIFVYSFNFAPKWSGAKSTRSLTFVTKVTRFGETNKWLKVHKILTKKRVRIYND